MIEVPKDPFYTIYVFEEGVTYDKPLCISVATELSSVPYHITTVDFENNDIIKKYKVKERFGCGNFLELNQIFDNVVLTNYNGYYYCIVQEAEEELSFISEGIVCEQNKDFLIYYFASIYKKFFPLIFTVNKSKKEDRSKIDKHTLSEQRLSPYYVCEYNFDTKDNYQNNFMLVQNKVEQLFSEEQEPDDIVIKIIVFQDNNATLNMYVHYDAIKYNRENNLIWINKLTEMINYIYMDKEKGMIF